MAKKASKRPRTIFDDVEPLSEEELRQLKERSKEWFRERVQALLVMADHDPELARHLCECIADHFGADDELGPLMKSRISVDRQGKPRGRRKWDRVALSILLEEYAVLRREGRAYALEWRSSRRNPRASTCSQARRQASRLVI